MHWDPNTALDDMDSTLREYYDLQNKTLAKTLWAALAKAKVSCRAIILATNTFGASKTQYRVGHTRGLRSNQARKLQW